MRFTTFRAFPIIDLRSLTQTFHVRKLRQNPASFPMSFDICSFTRSDMAFSGSVGRRLSRFTVSCLLHQHGASRNTNHFSLGFWLLIKVTLEDRSDNTRGAASPDDATVVTFHLAFWASKLCTSPVRPLHSGEDLSEWIDTAAPALRSVQAGWSKVTTWPL
jgi:hypothetical protein